ncbi:MAG: 3'-5' exonuclease, partial [Methanobacteriaceae archaeon]|nr:3'-5' exonuclease [Methanobacteriaceae archaeon]
SKNENIETEDKTDIKSIIDNDNIPVLGMFRNNEQELARDLSKLIGDLSKGKEVKLKVRKILDKEYFESINSQNQDKLMESRKRSAEKAKKAGRISLKLDSENGSLGDMAVLTFSPKESFQGHHMFPLFLKKNLERLKEPISIFNPKGQDFQSIKEVSILCGLILECIDPESKIQKSNTKIPKLALRYMKKWRKIAKEFIDSSPEPHNPISLADFVTRWQLRQAYPSSEKWPKKASLLELTYKLASWIQEFQDDVEGLIYLESITKTISQNGFFNEYSANIYFDSYENEVASIEEAIWNIFIPIATGGVKLEESSFETLPPNRLNIMSIHQSKGLEFPLVIVDVGSRFDKNKISDSNLRFPKKSDNSSNLEDKIRSYSSLGKSDRNSCDRSFDDLTRLYFVAFSRAQEVLLLIGLTKGLEGYKSKDTYLNIPNVALGWNRDNEFKGFDELYLI